MKITSVNNELIKETAKLLQRKYRDEKGLFFVVLCGVRDIGGLEFGSGGDVWVEDKEFKRKGKIGCV